MKYLKYCEDTGLGVDYNYDHSTIGIIEGQPKQGPTVICFKNPDTGVTRTVYTGKNIFKEDESPIQYTWRYEESYNGHPAIIVNFSRIDSKYVNNIVCLESNNMCKGGDVMGTINKYDIKGENNNRALNVLSYNNSYKGELNIETKNVTWYRLGDLRLNTNYPIFITVPGRYIWKAHRMSGKEYEYISNDWEVRINVRPTIRGNLGYNMPNISYINSATFRHTNRISAKDYIFVKFPYRDIFQL